jgi:type IV secretion system protein VirB10
MAADPLAPPAVRPAGLVAWKVAAVAGLAGTVGLATFMAMDRNGQAAAPQVARLVAAREPETRGYADLRQQASVAVPDRPPERPPAPAPAPAPRLTEATAAVPAGTAPAGGGQRKRDDLWDRAMEAGVGGWSADDGERKALDGVQVASAGAGTSANPLGLPSFAGSACAGFVKPGTPIRATLINRVSTERGGIATLNVDADVWNTGMDVLAVPGASTMTVEYVGDVSRGQRRVAFANPTIVRPWPRSDVVQVSATTADASGASGLPGYVNVPWFQTGLLVAASTAVDLGVAALTGGGSILGAILADNADSPLDRVAKDLWERAPVIELDPGEQVLVFLKGGLCADDFRG